MRRPALPLLLAVSALAIAAGLLVACGATPSRNAKVPQPAKAVDAARYLGRWYEVARYDQPFEKDCEAATADYGLLPDGRVSVVNACRKGGVEGKLTSIRGTAKAVAGSDGAKLKVKFFNGLVTGDYWVLDHDADYAWSIVGEGSGRFLWLLARTPLEGADRDALVARAGALGYDTAALHFTRHAAVR